MAGSEDDAEKLTYKSFVIFNFRFSFADFSLQPDDRRRDHAPGQVPLGSPRIDNLYTNFEQRPTNQSDVTLQQSVPLINMAVFDQSAP